MIVVENKMSNEQIMDLIFEVWNEKENNGMVTKRCPNCGQIIDIDIVGNSAKTKCSCGLMNRKLRGI